MILPGMCYIPAPHRAVVLSDKRVVRAVSPDTNKTTWETKDKIDGEYCQPIGLLYSPKHR